jgi:hypothetical protein
MPTKPLPGKPVRKVKKPIKPVKPMGSRPLVIYMACVLVAIVGLSAYYLLKSPSAPPGFKADAAKVQGESPGADIAAGPVKMAVSKAKLQLETVDGKGAIKVIIDRAVGSDGRDVVYRFDWTLNGQPAGDGSDRLSGFKQGDRVAVKVTPVEGGTPGHGRFIDLVVNNMPPRVVESKHVGFDGKTYTYQVTGAGQEGVPLSYTLEDAPQGMTINSRTGLISWDVKEGDHGERTFKVKIDDGKSGFAIHPVKVDIPKPSQETKPVEQSQ